MTWQDAFGYQARTCADLGSPFTSCLLGLVASRGLPAGAIRDRIAAWPGDISARGASVPLRLAGALHRLVLEARAPALAAFYPPNENVSDDALWSVVCEALVDRESTLMDWLGTPPQTNEVGRSAFLIPAAAWLTHITGLPLALSELGASAGLNLRFDRYALVAGERRFGPENPALTLSPVWRGMPPRAADLRVSERTGADLNPADPASDRLRLLSFIWPDQPDRLARMTAAIGEARRTPATIERTDAIDYLARRLAQPMPGRLHMIFHTIAWQYFPAAAQQRGKTLLARAGALATREAPLARVAMEADDRSPGAGLKITLWPGGRCFDMGRADFHGRWIDWQAPDPEPFRW
ncbi:MAG: DUF2332 family protein [Rhodobacteraceae bacterium]|nr:DUF2332 family protein [Paracoccaceae bacterium]